MKVKDNPQFERDSTGAIINTDTDAYNKYIKAKKNRENKMNDFIKIVDNILGEYVKANSIDLVLNKKDIIMGKSSFNITEEILKKVNELK